MAKIMPTRDNHGSTPAMRFTPNFDVRFPPLPRTITRLSQLTASSGKNPDVRELAEIVHADPVVASAVLRRINSAYYGMRRRVSSIQKAVFLLGSMEVSNLALAAAMLRLREVIPSAEQGHIFDYLMRKSVGTASYARHLADELHLPEQASSFTLGLMHEIGRLVLLYNKPDDYEALWYTNDRNVPPTPQAEKRIFGIDHAELGAMAAEDWNLPELICETIRGYLEPHQVDVHHIRIQALTLAVSTHLTGQLLRDPKRAEPLEPSPHLDELAEQHRTDGPRLLDVLNAHRGTVLSYIDTMMMGNEYA